MKKPQLTTEMKEAFRAMGAFGGHTRAKNMTAAERLKVSQHANEVKRQKRRGKQGDDRQ